MSDTATARPVHDRTASLPPGPRGALLQVLIYMRDPYRYHREAIRRYGPVFFVPGLTGDMVMTCEPEHLRTLFALEPPQFVPFGTKEMTPVIGAGSLLLLGGETHRRERKLLTPPFHGARMRAYGQLMQEVALEVAGALRPGEVFKLQEAMQDISLRIILRAVFGLLGGEQAEEARRRIVGFVGTVSPAILFFTFLQREFLGHGPWARFLRARQALDAVLFEHIRTTRAGRGGGSGDDILSLLLGARYDDGTGMSDEQVRDQLLTLLFAGHETTALGLSWLFSFVFRQPEVLRTLRAELDALGPDPEPETIAAQPYLEAVCQEALRIYPVAAEVFRLLREPLELGRHVIPSDVAVAASIYGVHRRPELYPDGESFRPERFLERKFSPFEYLPFGGGNRRCLGAAFAMYEMKLVVHALVRRYDFRPAHERLSRPTLRGLTMGPHDGAPMVLVGSRS
jgi:cytochrome P450